MRKSPNATHRPFLVACLATGTLLSLSVYGGTARAAAAPKREASSQTLEVLDGAPSGANSQDLKDYYNYLATRFKKATGATLTWDYYASSSEETSDIETATISGSGPDVISYGTSFVGTLWATGDFAPLTPGQWAQLGGEGSFVKSELADSGLKPSEYIGVPYDANPYVLAYNTKYFQEAGIASPPKSWGQLVADAQKIQAKVKGVYGVGIDPEDAYDPWKNVFFYDADLGGAKPWEWINPAGTKVDLTTPQMEQAVKFYFALENQFHVAPPQSVTWNSSDLKSAFTGGKVAMVILAEYDYEVLQKGTPLQGHLGFAPLPTVPYGDTAMPPNGIPVSTITSGEYWAVPKYASKLGNLALDFEKISLTPQAQLEDFKLLGEMPVTEGGIKAVEAYDKNVVPFVKSEEDAVATSIAPVWSYVETGLLTALHNIGSYLVTHGGKWDSAYAAAQLKQAQGAAQIHATGFPPAKS
jgi:multiple sugar transport system substrate-binding protein